MGDQTGAPRVMIFAGPSGGHLYPAIAFAEAFRQRHPQCVLDLVTSERAQKILSQEDLETFHKYHYLDEFPFLAGKGLKQVGFLLKLFKAFLVSAKILSAFRPQLCVGFGSFVSFPGMKLASLKKIPTLIHEQNVIPGKATCWLANDVDQVALTFEQTLQELDSKKRVVVGLPLRRVLCQSASQSNLQDTSKFNLLVFGGSQGAKRLNEAVLGGLELLSNEEKAKIAVNHITGMADCDSVKARYENLGIGHQVFPFSEKIQDLYGEATMAITRAGANTLFELALFGIPGFVIPYPHAGSHQLENAKYFESKGLIEICSEDSLSFEKVANKIRSFLNHPELAQEKSLEVKKLSSPEAAEKLVALSEKVLNHDYA